MATKKQAKRRNRRRGYKAGSDPPGNWVEFLAGRNPTGPITETTALTLSAVYRASSLRGNSMGILPFLTYERVGDDGKDRATDQPAYRLLHQQPNPYTTPFRFKRQLEMWRCLRGNGYAEIERRRGTDEPVNLWMIHPSRVKPEVQSDSSVIWVIYNDVGPTTRIPDENMYHVMGESEDGIVGKSVIQLARESLSLSSDAEKYGRHFYQNSATPSGIIRHPGTLKPAGRENIRRTWEKKYAGSENAGKTAILEEGMEYQALGLSNEDAQYLETRKFQVVEVARWFGIPPHMLMDLERATFSNIEHQQIEFVTFCMLPLATDFEQEANRKLIAPADRDTFFCEMLMDVLLRATLKERYDAYAVARQWGWMSANDVLKTENKSPIGDQGDIYWAPVNMVPADKLGQQRQNQPQPTQQGGPNGTGSTANGPDQEEEPDGNNPPIKKLSEAIVSSYSLIFADVIGRMLVKESKAAERAEGKEGGLSAWSDAFFTNHALLVRCALIPACEGCAAAVSALSGNVPSGESVADITRRIAMEHIARSRSAMQWIDVKDRAEHDGRDYANMIYEAFK